MSTRSVLREIFSQVVRWSVIITHRGVTISRTASLKGVPSIITRDGARIQIEDEVLLNSCDHGYHLSMHSRTKLYAEGKGARIRIGAGTRVHGSCIHAYSLVDIGRFCLIAANCQIMDGSGHRVSFDNLPTRLAHDSRATPVIVEDYVWIGAIWVFT